MNRKPPEEVKKVLRAEVGFCCPVPGCGSPYLEWHHFDPPWSTEAHHRAEGMIALCREHHIQADNGAFTAEQLRQLKRGALSNWAAAQGKFNWMRNRLLTVAGGNFFYETLVAFKYRNEPVIWLERDPSGYLLLSLRMLTASGEPRACIARNEWFATGSETDIECPPSGKRVKIAYANGDYASVEFRELRDLADAQSRYQDATPQEWGITFPITAVEVAVEVAGTGLSFSARETRIAGAVMKNCFASHCGAGLVVG